MRFSGSVLASWLGVLALAAGTARADGPGLPNRSYNPGDVYRTFATIKPQLGANATYNTVGGAGINIVGMHCGYLLMPYSRDAGGGYIGGGNSGGFALLDLSNPANPVVVFDTANHLSVYYDASSPDYLGEIAETHSLNIWGDIVAFSLTRNGQSKAGFAFVDLGPFYNGTGLPHVVGRIYWTDNNTDDYNGYSFNPAWHSGRYLYAPLGNSGMRILDTSNPAHTVEAARFTPAQLGNFLPRSAHVQGNLLFLHDAHLGGSDNEAGLYDISNPLSPVLLSRFVLVKNIYEVAFTGDRIYSTSFSFPFIPLDYYDIRDPTQPVRNTLDPLLDSTREPSYVTFADDKLFLGVKDGAKVYRLDQDGNATAEAYWYAVAPGVKDFSFNTVLGNLLFNGSDRSSGFASLLAHQPDPDTKPPRVLTLLPRNGSTNLAPTCGFGLCFSDTLDMRTVTDATFVFRRVGGAAVSGRWSLSDKILNFAPDNPLEENATYELILPAGGVKDLVGNALAAEFRAAFSTGANLVVPVVQPGTLAPAIVGESALFTAQVTGGPIPLPDPVLWSWDFGDGTQTTPAATPIASHSYSRAGDYPVTVTLQYGSDRVSARTTQVVHLPPTPMPPTHSGTIVCDVDAGVVWNVNPDNDTVSAIDAATMAKLAEVPVGDEPRSMALAPGGELWVSNAASATISVIDRAGFNVKRTILLAPGSRPAGLVFKPDGTEAYVALEDTGEILWLSPGAVGPKARLRVGSKPFGLAASVDGRLLVTRFISPDTAGEIYVVDTANVALLDIVPVAKSTEPDSLTSGRGLPNYLAHPAISPDGTNAWVPGKKDNIDRGAYRDGLPLTHDNTVRSIAVKINLLTQSEALNARQDFDNMDVATAVEYDSTGNLAFFTTLGSQSVVGVEVHGSRPPFVASSGGQAPLGLALDPVRKRLFVHNFMSRSVSALDLTEVLARTDYTLPIIGATVVVEHETLPPEVLRGKQLFYDSRDNRLSTENYMSCASCHFGDGGDGRVWDLTSLGEGLRNTIDLHGRGIGHGPLHWSSNFDEVQDFEQQVRDLNFASGMLSDTVFAQVGHPLDASKAGLDADLDALAAYVHSLDKTGGSPWRKEDDTLSDDALAGRQLFQQLNCAACHGGAAFTDSWTGVRHDVGTLTPASGHRLSAALDGLDTPTLRGLWRTAPYLHDGSAPTLRDVLTARNQDSRHADVSGLSSAQVDKLVAYLLQIDDHEPAAPAGPVVFLTPAASIVNGPVAVEVRFSEAVTGLTADDFVLANGVVAALAGTGADYTLVVEPLGEGAVTVRLPAGRVNGATGSNAESLAARFDYFAANSFIRLPVFRYVRLTGLAGVNDFISAAELNLRGRDGVLLPRAGWLIAAVSSDNAQVAGQVAGYVLDDDAGTIWRSRWWTDRVYPPQDITLDMRAPQILSAFVYQPPPANNSDGTITQYQLHGSNNLADWELIGAGSWPATVTAKEVALDFQPRPRKYFKLVADMNFAGGRAFHAAEIELLDENGVVVAPGGSTVAGSSSAPGFAASSAVDGNDATAWRSNDDATGPAELVFTLSAAIRPGGFRYVPETDAGPSGNLRFYRFYSSADGNDWALVSCGELPAQGAPQLVALDGPGAVKLEFPADVDNEFIALNALAMEQRSSADYFDATPAVSPFARWAGIFGAAGGPDGNPDGDAYPNFLEWQFGSNPLTAEPDSGRDVRVTLTPDGYWHWRTSLLNPASVGITPEISGNLIHWTPMGAAAQWEFAPSPSLDGRYDVDFYLPRDSSSNSQFLRVLWSIAP